MADYIAITDSQIEPEAPVTSELMNQLRDNPIAIAGGAVDAPRVVSEGMVLFPVFEFNSAYTAPTNYWGGVCGFVNLTGQASASSRIVEVRYQTSDDGGTTTSAWQTLVSKDIGTSSTDPTPFLPFNETFASPINWITFDEDGDSGGDVEPVLVGLMYGAA